MTEREKRKANGPPPSDAHTPRSSKRHKAPTTPKETPEATTESGLQFLSTLKSSKDKHGQLIVGDFIKLPDKKTPGYYKQIKLPIALDTIEAKLKKYQYANMSALEGDFKRMISNAKEYNSKGSSVYENAEKIRKATSGFMFKANPAYKDPNFTVPPTPIPHEATEATEPIISTPSRGRASNRRSLRGRKSQSMVPDEVEDEKKEDEEVTVVEKEEEEEDEAEVEAEDEDGQVEDADVEIEAAAAAASNEQEERKEREREAGDHKKAETDVENERGEKEVQKKQTESDADRFRGLSFREAQERIIVELIDRQIDGLQIYTPFITLPPKTLTDYYQVINRPISLRVVQKGIRGQHGRNPPTYQTDFQTWDTFEKEVGLIWNNAQAYNEDGSDMYLLANEFKEDFMTRLAEAKKLVEQPKSQTVKINFSDSNSSKIKIKFGATKDIPGKEKLTKDTPSTTAASTPAPDRSTPGTNVQNESHEQQQQPINGVKSSTVNGAVSSQSSPPNSVNGITPQPSSGVASQPSSGVTSQPSAAVKPAVTPQKAIPGLYANNPSGQTTSFLDGPPTQLVKSRTRPTDQSSADYLLPSIQLQSHPSLLLTGPFKSRILASRTSLQTSTTFTLAGQHHSLQLRPHIPVGHTNRPYRLFVSVNGQRLSEVVKPGEERDKSKPAFELRLDRGTVNRVEVEILAGRDENAQASGKKGEVQWEKMTCLINLRK